MHYCGSCIHNFFIRVLTLVLIIRTQNLLVGKLDASIFVPRGTILPLFTLWRGTRGLMAYWFGRLSLFGFCFLNSSAEMCAGSLALVVGSLAFLQPDLRFMVPMGVIWHGRCLYFGVLGDPGTILGRSWDIGGHKEGPCEVQAWILSIFC